MENDPIYKRTLDEAKRVRNDPVGLSRTDPQGQIDNSEQKNKGY